MRCVGNSSEAFGPPFAFGAVETDHMYPQQRTWKGKLFFRRTVGISGSRVNFAERSELARVFWLRYMPRFCHALLGCRSLRLRQR